MKIELTGEIALVTGASRGIGKGIALSLAAAGATVIGTATTPAGAASITEYLHAAGFAEVFIRRHFGVAPAAFVRADTDPSISPGSLALG